MERSELDKSSRELIESILEKSVSDINEVEMGILMARRDYLTTEEKEKFLPEPKVKKAQSKK